MNRLCTTQQQSQRLLEAGVSPETADLYLQRITETEDWSSDNVQDQIIEPWINKPGLLDMVDHYPAWSLSKLIYMMPPFVEGIGWLRIITRLNTEKYNAYNKVEVHQYSIEYGVKYTSHRYDDPFEAFIEAIEWLIKEGKFPRTNMKVDK